MINLGIDWGDNFQTPEHVCKYMASLLDGTRVVYEPTPGKGNLIRALRDAGHAVLLHLPTMGKYHDSVVMNPPFSPMKQGYDILYEQMGQVDRIVALMPYLTIINSERRLKDIMAYGLKSITNLPRSTFKGSRVQTCILDMERGYTGQTIFIDLPR